MITIDDLRLFAGTRSFFQPTTLKRAIEKMGFVQADPIRSPARAQDLILRHRVRSYRSGDLERRYQNLGVEEDFFVTYGFVTPSVYSLMHPRSDTRVPADSDRPWHHSQKKKAEELLEFVRERGTVHPREVDERFSHGKVRNYWGGSSNATTQLLDAMHYRGLLRVERREAGIRLYTARVHEPIPEDPTEVRRRLDALADVAIRLYSPLPASSLSDFIRRLRFAVPQWRHELVSARLRAKDRLAHAKVDGVDWYWPREEDPKKSTVDDRVRLLAPFDPVVRDRARFELLWNWVYRFEAYTPAHKRKLGYYALPLLWRGRVIGWGNLSVKKGELISEIGYVDSRSPLDRTFSMRNFLE